MFVGRKRELNVLDSIYQSNNFEMVVVYGMRRVGKTELLKQFIKDKEVLYHTCIYNSSSNLKLLSKAIFEYNKVDSNAAFESFMDAMEYIFKLSIAKKILFVLDEYPNLAISDPSINSILQALIDKYKDVSKLKLILCGSSISYMTDKVMNGGPLYGRKTAQMEILPFNFNESMLFFPNYSNEEKAICYGLLGGIPLYLRQFSDKLSIKENVKRTFFNSSSLLFLQPISVLQDELREPTKYNSIIEAISKGKNKLTEIADYINESTAVVSTYMRKLINIHIVEKEKSYNGSDKKTIYIIKDNMFRFWYSMVSNNLNRITLGKTDILFKDFNYHISQYMGPVFENICKQYLNEDLSYDSEVIFKSLGRWWGGDPVTKKPIEIDIVGEQNKNVALLGECKWTNEKIDLNILNTLNERKNVFHYSTNILYLFSKSGFTKGCIEEAKKMGNVKLVTLDDMVTLFNKKLSQE